MKYLKYLMDHILYKTFKIIFIIILKKREKLSGNLPIRIYVNKIENRITFKSEREYYLKLLIPETLKLLVSTKVR